MFDQKVDEMKTKIDITKNEVIVKQQLKAQKLGEYAEKTNLYEKEAEAKKVELKQ